MKIANFCSFILILTIGSCSFFVNGIDTDIINLKEYEKNIPEVATYCPLDQSVTKQIIGSDGISQKSFLDFLSRPQFISLDFIDQFALWTLIQMSLRPDQSSMSSRFQVLFDFMGTTHYFDFYSEETKGQYPMMYGLDWILKKFKKNNKIEHYASLLDLHLPREFKVSRLLEDFLIKHASEIKAHTTFANLFVRGTEVLQEGEKTPPISFRSLVSYYRKSEKQQKIIVNTTLNEFLISEKSKGQCNYDLNLYKNSIFLIDQNVPKSNIFGIATTKNTFMASTTQKNSKIESINGFPLFDGSSKTRSSAVCILEEKTQKIWIYSNQSRDPGQHLFQILRYGLGSSSTIPQVDRLIRHSRYLFLSDPLRLVIESQRSRPEQIEGLLKMNIPIYNAEHLGNIWTYSSINSINRFIIDDRNEGAFLCK